MAEEEPKTIHKGRFAFQMPALLCPVARLYADRLELSGWRLRGRYHRVIPLRQVMQIDTPSSEELLIWLSIGETLRLSVRHATRWKAEIETSLLRLQRHRSNGNRRES